MAFHSMGRKSLLCRGWVTSPLPPTLVRAIRTLAMTISTPSPLSASPQVRAGQSQDRVWGFTFSLFLISFGEAYKMPLTEWVTKMNQVPGAPSQEREFCHEQTGGSPAA